MLVSVLAGLIAALLGSLLSIAELISRYRDDPARAVWSFPAAIYVGVNSMASAAALWLSQKFGWTFGMTGETVSTLQVIVAGFGAAALFRSSLFNVTVGDRLVGVGPAAVLNVILSAADRAVDRKRARIRFEKTSDIMRGVPFADYADSLVMHCLAAMQNASPAESKAIGDKLLSLRSKTSEGLPDQVKSLVLGLALQEIVGDRVLDEVVKRLKTMVPPTGIAAEPAPTAAKVLDAIMQGDPIPVRTLQQYSSMTLGPFNGLLRQLTEDGSIEVTGEPGNETVTLAGKG